MKKFSTGPLLFACWVPAGAVSAQEPPPFVVSPPLPEYILSPRPRVLAPLPQAQQAGDDSARPQAMVLDGDAGPFAEVTGLVAARDVVRDAAQMFVSGQMVRIAPVGASGAPLEEGVSIYRLGPTLGSADGRTALGRMAYRIGSARIVRRDADGKATKAVIAHGNREIAAGDIVLDARAWPAAARQETVRAVAARVALQSGAERMRLAAMGQVVGLDRGALDGVRAGMCLRAAECDRTGDVVGRVLHAGGRASVARLEHGAALLAGGDEVCIAACPD